MKYKKNENLREFLCTKNIANFEAFHWVISSSIILLFLKSEGPLILTYYSSQNTSSFTLSYFYFGRTVEDYYLVLQTPLIHLDANKKMNIFSASIIYLKKNYISQSKFFSVLKLKIRCRESSIFITCFWSWMIVFTRHFDNFILNGDQTSFTIFPFPSSGRT